MRESDAQKIANSQPLTEGYQPFELAKGYQAVNGKTFDGFQPTAKDFVLSVTRPLPLGGSSVIPAGASYSENAKPIATSKK